MSQLSTYHKKKGGSTAETEGPKKKAEGYQANTTVIKTQSKAAVKRKAEEIKEETTNALALKAACPSDEGNTKKRARLAIEGKAPQLENTPPTSLDQKVLLNLIIEKITRKFEAAFKRLSTQLSKDLEKLEKRLAVVEKSCAPSARLHRPKEQIVITENDEINGDLPVPPSPTPATMQRIQVESVLSSEMDVDQPTKEDMVGISGNDAVEKNDLNQFKISNGTVQIHPERKAKIDAERDTESLRDQQFF